MVKVQFDEATHTYTIDGKEYPSVTNIVRFLSYDQSKNADPQMALMARERGTEVHEATALYDYSGEIPGDLSADSAPYVSAYVQFLRDYKPEWKFIEHIMGDAGLGYCGTLDRAGFIGDDFCILDIKTSYKVNMPSLFAQLYAYNRLFNHCHNEWILENKIHTQNLFGLQLMRNGKYRLYKADSGNATDLFYACQMINSVTESMKGVRYAVR